MGMERFRVQGKADIGAAMITISVYGWYITS